jgi:hypothetical protein
MKKTLSIALVAALASVDASADPCGMVPPVWEGQGQGPTIRRVGLQKTYVFFDKGVETFVIRPGFSGDVDNFGMLIPFPSVPSLRKVPDNTFAHVAAAVDPPEVIVDLRPPPPMPDYEMMDMPSEAPSMAAVEEPLALEEVRVLKKEAVGMYEIAVLAAGSPKALNRWMDDHGYQYPKGMDAAVFDYVKARWCFVAVKTRVGAKEKVNPRPGMRSANPARAPGSRFSGNVQAMGFRFPVKELVVPMRLSTFNEGELRNIVYVLTKDPIRIKDVNKDLVRRQLKGRKLRHNLEDPLPVRVLGGTWRDVSRSHRASLKSQRDPSRHVSVARDLFASDVLAAKTGELALDYEEREKALLNVSERLNLRDPAIDALHDQELTKMRARTLRGSLPGVDKLTLTVIDGDFPRKHLAENNLTFARWKMPFALNHWTRYHAPSFGPRAEGQGDRVEWNNRRDPHPAARFIDKLGR